MKSIARFAAAALVLVFGLMPLPATAQDDQGLMVERARRTLETFMRDSQLVWLRENAPKAHAIMIIPEMVKLGVVIGVSGGTGVAYRRNAQGQWTGPVFYHLTSGSFGLQLGAQVSEVMLVMTNERGAAMLHANSFKLGPDASIAAGPVGAGAGGAPIVDIVSYSRAQGLFAGISLEGTVLSPRDEWNSVYYGKDASPADVLDGKAASPRATEARSAVTRALTGK